MDRAEIELVGETVYVGWTEDLGTLCLTQEEIIRFAEAMDPLPVHTDPEFARQSPFGGIIASGSQLFIEFHKRYFIPRYGHHMVAGLGIFDWLFLQPHYPDTLVRGMLELRELAPKPEKGLAVIRWQYRFYDPAHTLLQSADFKVMHRYTPR